MRQGLVLLGAAMVGCLIWLCPIPNGLSEQAWALFSIFISTMIAIVLRPYPMGVIALISLAVVAMTKTLTFTEAFSGFSNEIVWLIVLAFCIARGFIASGLGNRMAYKIMSLFGKSSLGLGYGLVLTDLILAPTIPSVAARVGGIVYPIVRALADVFTGKSHDPKMGGFLALSAFQGSAITSAMFLTAMAGNPLIVELAQNRGITLTWSLWATAALLPGLISLAVVPYLLFRLISPVIRHTPHAKEMAAERLNHMGPMKRSEWIVLATLVLLIILWIIGPSIGLKPVIAASIGLAILLLSGVMKWKDVLDESGAWDTFVWFATLVTLSHFLNQFGLTQWISQWVTSHVFHYEWKIGFVFLILVYFYSHYFFASNVAHICAMFAPFLIVALALGTPPVFAVLSLGFLSSLFGGLTHYSSGPAPILFGTGFLSVSTWWKLGFIVSLVNIFIWIGLGSLWWKWLGLW